jgi:hypothetical protein
MRDFLSFVKERETIKLNEAFIQKDAEKAVGLIKTLLRKHIDSLVAIEGYANTTVGQEKCTTKYFIVPKSGHDVMFTMSWLSTEGTSQVYSIDFFDDTDLLWYGRSRSKLSLFTCGSSVAYFLPVIWNVVNSGDWSLSEKDARKYGEVIYGKVAEGSVEHPHYIGAQAYTVIENLSDRVIHDATVLAEAADAQLDSYVAGKRREKTQAWYGVYGGKDDVTQEDRDRFNKLTREYNEITAAINGGAQTISDLRMAIKRNVSVIDELNNIYGEQQKELDKQKFSIVTSSDKKNDVHTEDPDITFKKMSHYVKMVINGIQRSVILCGAPGVGKTFKVRTQLKAAGYTEGVNLFTIKGKCTPRQLYIALYEHQDKGDIIMIDDADALVGPKAPEDVINILKAALDSTSDAEGNLVSYQVTGDLKDDEGMPIPKRFYYNGGVIIITNWNAGSLDTALRGRSFVQDINFTTADILTIIKRLIPKIDPVHLSEKSKEKAFNYLIKLADAGDEMEISIRTFGICAKIFQTAQGDEEFTDEMAESMIGEQMKLQAARGRNKY